MDLISWVGIGAYMIGHGYRGLPFPNSGLTGSIIMIVGGVLVLVGALT